MRSYKKSNKQNPTKDNFLKVPHLKLACIVGFAAIAIILFVAAASSTAINRMKKLEKDMAKQNSDEITSVTSTTVEPDIYGMMDDYMDAYEIKTQESISEKIKNSMTGVSAEEVSALIKEALRGYSSSDKIADLLNQYFSTYNSSVDKKIEEINNTINKNTELTTEKLNDIYVKISSNQDDISALSKMINELKAAINKEISDLKASHNKDMSELKAGFSNEITELKSSLNKEITELKTSLTQDITNLKTSLDAHVEQYDTFVNNYNTSVNEIKERITVVENKQQVVISPTEPADHDVLWIVPCG